MPIDRTMSVLEFMQYAWHELVHFGIVDNNYHISNIEITQAYALSGHSMRTFGQFSPVPEWAWEHRN
jgi:hypothetical protein